MEIAWQGWKNSLGGDKMKTKECVMGMVVMGEVVGEVIGMDADKDKVLIKTLDGKRVSLPFNYVKKIAKQEAK